MASNCELSKGLVSFILLLLGMQIIFFVLNEGVYV